MWTYPEIRYVQGGSGTGRYITGGKCPPLHFRSTEKCGTYVCVSSRVNSSVKLIENEGNRPHPSRAVREPNWRQGELRFFVSSAFCGQFFLRRKWRPVDSQPSWNSKFTPNSVFPWILDLICCNCGFRKINLWFLVINLSAWWVWRVGNGTVSVGSFLKCTAFWATW